LLSPPVSTGAPPLLLHFMHGVILHLRCRLAQEARELVVFQSALRSFRSLRANGPLSPETLAQLGDDAGIPALAGESVVVDFLRRGSRSIIPTFSFP